MAGKYRVIRVLGQGGMGVVVEAEHARLGERVAIKFLSAFYVQDREARERFEREARATVSMQSDHIARVRDVGELETGQPYLVMELLRGMDLAQCIDREAMPVGRIVNLMLQACEALAEAHATHIVHRDIKPANLFLTDSVDGTPKLKVLDFGVSTAPAEEVSLTRSGTVMGTPAYMCPEQMRSSRGAEATWDVWSLGAVLYEAIEGALPFAGNTFAELAVSVLTAPPVPPTLIPAGLDRVVARCLDKSAPLRYQNMYELAAALAPFAESQEQAERTLRRTARALGLGAGPVAATAPPAAGVPPVRLSEVVATGPTRVLESGVLAPSAEDDADANPSTHRLATTPRRGRRWALLALVVVGGIAGWQLVSRMSSHATPTAGAFERIDADTASGVATLPDAADAAAGSVDAATPPSDAAPTTSDAAPVPSDAPASTRPRPLRGSRPDAAPSPPDARPLTTEELMKGRT